MHKSEENRDISKSRLIAALLAELDASGAIVLAECPHSKQVFHNTISCDFRVPFEDTRVLFPVGGSPIKTLRCVCCYGGQRLSFELSADSEGSWSLPNLVTISELRSDPRIAFAERMYSAELIGHRGACYGYAIDVNRDFLAVELDSNQVIGPGEDVRVIVRLVNTNFDVFYNSAKVSAAKATDDGKTRVILKLDSLGQSREGQRQFERVAVDGASLRLDGNPFSDGNLESGLKIDNISSGGMTVSVRSAADAKQLMSGVVVRSQDPKISYIVVWSRGSSLGLRPLLFDAEHLGRWYQYVDHIAPPLDRATSTTRRELADLLTHSGLLKGSRRSPLGRDIQAHIISGSAQESPLLIQRCIVRGNGGHAGLHVSSKRISELSWFFGEGAALTEKFGDYNAMLEACTKRMVWMSRHSRYFCRYLTGIWHHTVKSTASWGNDIGQDPSSRIFDSYQCSIGSNSGASTAEATTRLINAVSAEERREIANTFSPKLYEAFVGADGTHPILNSELGKFGPFHYAVSKIVVSANWSIGLVAHRIFTHNVWSSTGVTNSVFVLVPSKFEVKFLQEALATLAADEISHGTDDFLVIVDGAHGAGELVAPLIKYPKRFSFLIHDLTNSSKYAVEDQSNSVKKRST